MYCGLDAVALERWDLHEIDHLVPKSVGGTDEPLNLVVACHGCNARKKDYDPTLGGTDPLTDESRTRLIDRARTVIEEQRAKWNPDFLQILREAGRRLGRGEPGRAGESKE